MVESREHRKLSTARNLTRHLPSPAEFLISEGDGKPVEMILWPGFEILNTSRRLQKSLTSRCEY